MLCNVTQNIIPALDRQAAMDEAYEELHDQILRANRYALSSNVDTLKNELVENVIGDTDAETIHLIATLVLASQGNALAVQILDRLADYKTRREA